MRRRKRSTRRMSAFLWVAAALLVGMFGLGYRRHDADSHATGRAGTPSKKADARSNSGAHPSEPTGVRNG